MNPLIQLRSIRKSFGDRTILQDVTLDIPRNQITAIIGKSGAGKSVLVKHIMGLMEADSGEIIFDGLPYSTMTRKDFSGIKSRCSYMFQHNALFDSLTVFENIALPLRECSALRKKEIAERVRSRIAQLELSDVAEMYPREISGGMQKRVALARALITNPEIIFFDEPTTGLDPLRKKNVFTMIHDSHRKFNFTAVIITHDIPDIFYIAHQVHILGQGEIIFSGSPIELEQSSSPVLYAYTHGHEMLTDELTGLRNKALLVSDISQLAQGLSEASPLLLATIRLAGFGALMENQGHLLAHGFIKKLAEFLHGIWPKEGFSGMYSREVVVLAAAVPAHYQPAHYQTEDTARTLRQFFASPEVVAFCQQHELGIEIGTALLARPGTASSLVNATLATAKKCI